jgi:hypothetical protein
LLSKLIEQGVLIPKREASDEVYFGCALSEQDQDSVPQAARRPASVETNRADGLIVNQRLTLQTGDEPPDSLAERVPYRDRFLPDRPILWVEDSGTEVLSPYWLGGDLPGYVARLISGDLTPDSLPPRVCAPLSSAHVLVSSDYESAQAEAWEAACARAREEIETSQYAILRQVIHPLQLSALREYFSELNRKGYLKESSNRHYATNRRTLAGEDTARFVHQQITPLVSRITPAPVVPTHTTLATYKPGASLRRHTDITECVWNISLLIDSVPEADAARAWPFYLEIEGLAREVRLGAGDAVLYRGRETPHWRETLPEGHEATLIFCCFAPQSHK